MFCVNLTRKIIWSSTYLNLSGSDGIASDPVGNVYVVDRNSNNLHPVALASGSKYQKPFSSNDGGDEVLVYDVIY